MKTQWKQWLSLSVCSVALSLAATGCKEKPVVNEYTSNAEDFDVDADNIEPLLGSAEIPTLRSDIEVKSATSTLKPTKGNKAHGTVTFTVVDGGVKVVADFDDLTPGKHGFHVHEKGDCSAPDASSAGGHFNPDNRKHGGPDSEDRHVGDLGNVEADANGHAHYERIDKVIALKGTNSILGRSVILHEKADDYKSQPAGDSGSRIACGVIEAIQ